MRGNGGLAGLVRGNPCECAGAREGRVGLSAVRAVSFVLKYVAGPDVVSAATVRTARWFSAIAGVVPPHLASVADLRSSVLPVRGYTEELVAEDNALL